MFGFSRVNSLFDKEIKRCIAERRTHSVLNNVKFKSAKSYALSNGISTKDNWGNYQEPSDSYLTFDKIINGEKYRITLTVTMNGETELIVHTPEQSNEYAQKRVAEMFEKK